MRKTNRSPDFLSKFPLGKVPAFESADGTVRLFESDAITQYIAESGPAAGQLLGSTAAERAVIRQWIVFAEGEVMGSVVKLVLWRVGLSSFNEASEKAGMVSLERALACLETHLDGRTWLASEGKLTLADISAAAALVWGFSMVIDAEMRTKYPRVVDWYKRTVDSDGVKQAFGQVKFIEKRQAGPA